MSNRVGFLGVDQYGNTYILKKHPRKELIEQFGCKHVERMYRDTQDGHAQHVGYIIQHHWIDIYQVCTWK